MLDNINGTACALFVSSELKTRSSGLPDGVVTLSVNRTASPNQQRHTAPVKSSQELDGLLS